jgi:hypothetical protein
MIMAMSSVFSGWLPYFLGMDASHMHPKYIDAIRYILHSQSKP